MANFGVLCPPSPSHITGFAAIGRELTPRGHRVTLFNILDTQGIANRERLEFKPLGVQKFPPGFYKRYLASQAASGGLKGIQLALNTAAAEIDMWIDEGVDRVRSTGVDLLLVDKIEFVGSTVAEILKIPFVTVCNACITDRRNPSAPPTGWPYSDSSFARLRNRAAWGIIDLFMSPLKQRINRHRRVKHLKPIDCLTETSSPYAEIAQQTQEFDYPRLPNDRFHYIGVFQRGSEDILSFPFERLNGKPLLYATFGTISRAAPGALQTLCRASGELGMQLVLGLGGTADASDYRGLGEETIVASYAPQRALLKRATLTFCHSGLNTVLESLACGVPVLAIPTDLERQSVAARLVRSGAGEKIHLREISCSLLKELLGRLATEAGYRQNAERIGASIERAGGERRAADIIEGFV